MEKLNFKLLAITRDETVSPEELRKQIEDDKIYKEFQGLLANHYSLYPTIDWIRGNTIIKDWYEDIELGISTRLGLQFVKDSKVVKLIPILVNTEDYLLYKSDSIVPWSLSSFSTYGQLYGSAYELASLLVVFEDSKEQHKWWEAEE